MIFEHSGTLCPTPCTRHGLPGSWAVSGRGPKRLTIAARLRTETPLPIKWIAARVQIGTAKGAKSVLPHLTQSQDQRKTASALESCAQLEFQSTVDPFLAANKGPVAVRRIKFRRGRRRLAP